MSTAQQLLDAIEAYLAKTGMSATAFGMAAMHDPSFVFEVRMGRVPSVATLDRVRNYMASTRRD